MDLGVPHEKRSPGRGASGAFDAWVAVEHSRVLAPTDVLHHLVLVLPWRRRQPRGEEPRDVKVAMRTPEKGGQQKTYGLRKTPGRPFAHPSLARC
mmetsp:Transcript_11380/g.41640  ORF Transcript_11380/g.41640 Transcript_11380/m.41640 type:complete len:95 (+) Transcript_11380:462-746(+)